MITFGKDNKQFVFRSVGIMLNDGHVLLHRAGDNAFWSLPGGRVEFLEKAESTITREMKEELEVLFGRPVDMVEKEALRNPWRKRRILSTYKVVYAA